MSARLRWLDLAGWAAVCLAQVALWKFSPTWRHLPFWLWLIADGGIWLPWLTLTARAHAKITGRIDGRIEAYQELRADVETTRQARIWYHAHGRFKDLPPLPPPAVESQPTCIFTLN